MRICGQRAWVRSFGEVLLAAALLAASPASAADYYEGYLDDPTLDLASAYKYVELLQREIHMQWIGDDETAASEELLVDGFEALLIVSCATGRYNAHEDWIAYVEVDTMDLMYRKRGASVAQHNAPCALILTEAHAVRAKRLVERRKIADRPTVEVFDNRVGSYVAVEWPEQDSVVLLKNGESFPVPHTEAERDERESVEHNTNPEESERSTFFDENAFAFTSAVDTLDGIRRRSEYPLANEEFVSTIDVFQRDDLEADELTVAAARRRLEQLLVDEHKLLARVPPTLAQFTWDSTFGLEEWKELREMAPLEQRKELSRRWTLLAKIVLVASNNATSSMNCLRRAVCWNPSEVPAYLQMSSILEYYGYGDASCETMEKMLEYVDPVELRSGEMRKYLNSNFSHCSVIIRMATLWEDSIVIRYVVSASAVISLLHGILIALSFVNVRVGRYLGAE